MKNSSRKLTHVELTNQAVEIIVFEILGKNITAESVGIENMEAISTLKQESVPLKLSVQTYVIPSNNIEISGVFNDIP